ncbi:MAG: hypothetical protein M3401_01215, partial [Actinomycetota bacterium]|nr:hypothetical protein [Actinomycetota bacterium]
TPEEIAAVVASLSAAARALAARDGVGDYLRAQGESRVPVQSRERADAALRVFISRVFSEATEFVITDERLERAYTELEDALLDGRAQAVVVAPVLGLRIISPEIALSDGLSLICGDQLAEAPADAVWPRGADCPCVLACLTVTDDPGAPAPLTDARMRFRRLLSALRLFDPACVALGPVAWERNGSAPWMLGDLGTAGRARGELVIDMDSEDELRAFCSLIARRAPGTGELAWALRRFELGCERASAFDALTDHLLALRALLEPEGPASGRLAGRIAALCATEEHRLEVTERMAHAVVLERSVITGLAVADGAVEALLAELSGYLRALLRDVVCGHLDPDLCGLADRLLSESGTLAS